MPLIVAIDLQPMAPIEGVIQVQGDITNARTAEVVRTVYSSVCVHKFFFFPFLLNITCFEVRYGIDPYPLTSKTTKVRFWERL